MAGTTRRIVVGVDGSAASNSALAWADNYARETGSTMLLVAAWEWPQSYGQPMMFDGYHPDTDALAVLEKARASLTVPAGQVEISTPEGHPGPALVKAAKGAELLIVGSTGHRAISSILLGSISAYCLHHAECPVLVVR